MSCRSGQGKNVPTLTFFLIQGKLKNNLFVFGIARAVIPAHLSDIPHEIIAVAVGCLAELRGDAAQRFVCIVVASAC